MPRITFVRDVYGEGGAALYRAGYRVDVADLVAAKFITSGDAVLGEKDVPPPPTPKKSPLKKPLKVETTALTSDEVEKASISREDLEQADGGFS